MTTDLSLGDADDGLSKNLGRVIAQSVSSQPLAAEARFHAWVSPCGNYGWQKGTGRSFSPSSSLPCLYHFTVALHSHIYIIWG
jgi:hypothetical protein